MNKIKTSIAEMFIDEDGILCIKIFEGAYIAIQQSKENFEASKQLLGDKKALVLVDGSARFTITEEAKLFSASKEGSENRIAVAFVTNSFANQLVVNLYLKFNQPVVPTKMFSSKEKALKWLKTFYVMPGDRFVKKNK